MSRLNKNLITLVLVGAIGYLVISNLTPWKGYAYPDKHNLSKVIELGEFKTEEDCNRAAINTLQRVSSVSTGDYECQKN